MGTSTSEEYNIGEPIAYPNPANSMLYLSDIHSKINKIEILNLEEKIVLSHDIQDAAKELTINTLTIASG